MRARSLLAVCLALATASAALAQTYPFDIRKTNSLAFGAWRRIVPGEYGMLAWIASLDGTAGPLDRVTLGAKEFYYGKVCIPHDCGGNFIAFLIAVDGSEAFGLLDSRTLGVGHRVFGAANGEARRLLEIKIRQ